MDSRRNPAGVIRPKGRPGGLSWRHSCVGNLDGVELRDEMALRGLRDALAHLMHSRLTRTSPSILSIFPPERSSHYARESLECGDRNTRVPSVDDRVGKARVSHSSEWESTARECRFRQKVRVGRGSSRTSVRCECSRSRSSGPILGK